MPVGSAAAHDEQHCIEKLIAVQCTYVISQHHHCSGSTRKCMHMHQGTRAKQAAGDHRQRSQSDATSHPLTSSTEPSRKRRLAGAGGGLLPMLLLGEPLIATRQSAPASSPTICSMRRNIFKFKLDWSGALAATCTSILSHSRCGYAGSMISICKGGAVR